MPLELDQIYGSLDELNVALGPNGANENGALTDLLETTAANFGGQGAQFHQTIQDFSKLSETLDDNKEELFGSARELEGFISTLADQRPDGAAVQPVALQRLRPARRVSARSWPPRCTTSRSASATSPPSSRRTATSSARTSRTSTGWPRCWSSSATRSTRP